MEESAPSRRKSLNRKRRTAIYSDDDEDTYHSPSPPPPKKPKYDYEEEMAVDVEMDDDSDSGPSSRPLSRSPVSNRRIQKNQGSSLKSKKSSSKKRRELEESEDEFEADAAADDFDLGGNTEQSGDDDEFVEDVPKKGKSRNAAKGKGVKGSKGSKTKGKRAESGEEIIIRDERQGQNGEVSSSKIRIKPSLAAETNPPPEGNVLDPDKVDITSSLKKQKLPPIKKNKALAAGTPSTPAAGASKALPPATSTTKTATTADGVPATPVTPANRVSAALQGADFNLQDPGVYEMLFKNSSGNAPRAGNRRDNEDRRKHLDSLREADKAKRAQEAKHTFDLQAQMDKISAFEDRLRRVRSSVLYPNILGAKMRDVHVREEGEMQSSWYAKS
ncbi:hypothetical protein D9757_001893 [Collybiopsis confluens]|uniref:Uncharacterized protein n=1 Tax=Collybiopsis confluens TaxID=2823264 RepID=A0A8H5HXF9_9AGAR|nr:hypothetical protein D9757_001893 [Collybiopsis confluens]